MSGSISSRQYQREQKTLKQEIEKRTGRSAEQLYEERETRVRDAIELRMPDRVPFMVRVHTRHHAGIPNSAAYYDPLAYKRAIRQLTVALEPDMCDAGLPSSGAAMDALGVKNKAWPGGPLSPDDEYQYIEGEYLKEDEYDLFLNDPSDCVLRRVLPRIYGAASPLAKLPSISNLFQGFDGVTQLFATPEFIKMAESLTRAGRETQKFREAIGDSYEELAELGFPAFAPVNNAGAGLVPFDIVSSFLRGMKGSMTDMFRRPEKLLRLCGAILERNVARALPADPATRGNPKQVGIPLWRGDKVFMSEKQFDGFYWPGLKKVLQTDIDLGFVPVPFFEAKYGDRLERLLELPKGKVVASIEYVDALRAKDILKDHTCLYVRTPHWLKVCTIHEVEEFVKDLIDKCGRGGGLIIHLRLPNKGTTKEFRSLMDRLREYGRY